MLIIIKNKRFWLHITFWTLTCCFLTLFPIPIKFVVLNILFFMGLTYFSNFVLVDMFYAKRKFAQFILLYIFFIITYAAIVNQILNVFKIGGEEEEYIFTLIACFAFATFSTSLKIIRYSYKREVIFTKIENKQLKTELSLLKAQVNPHFLFNTLNNLYGLIVQNQNQKASDITLKLSDLMRYLLESSKTEQISLEKEIKFMEDYLVLEKIRLSAQADIRFEVYDLKKDIFVAPLLFISLVENAFKHGLLTISEESFAHFSLSVQGKDLFFEAKNSVGKSLDRHLKSGTGIDNLRKRLQLIYPQKHQLEIEETETLFKVTLHVQL